jgi:LysM repeat protein
VKAAETAEVKPSTYTVKNGDTLSAIARRIYGDAVNWLAFWQANAHRVHNPDYILPGQQLLTPAVLPTDITVKYTPPVPKARLSDVHPEVHAAHLAHLAHEAHGAVSTAAVSTAVTQPVTHRTTVTHAAAPVAVHSGTLTRAEAGALWLEAGGPASAEIAAENVAVCESGLRTDAYNPSGATGLWQILGAVLPGNLDDPLVNAENAVAKFKASGDTWAQWVCQP